MGDEQDQSTEWATARRFHPISFERQFATFAAVDPHFASLWAGYLDGLFSRDGLDLRTRILVLTGQYAIKENERALADTVQAAINNGVDLREVLETILQAYVYAGEGPVAFGVDVFVDVVGKAGLMEGVMARGLPVDATTAGRSLAEERKTWSKGDDSDPRMEGLLARYDWRGISDAVRLRPDSHLNTINYIDAFDPGFNAMWLDTVWAGLYARGVLDDKTRILCIVGDCFALGDLLQFSRHMQGALREGSHPKELLELIWQTCHVLGHPGRLQPALDDLMLLVDQMGRLSELVPDESRHAEVRKVRDARIGLRLTVADMKTSEMGLDR